MPDLPEQQPPALTINQILRGRMTARDVTQQDLARALHVHETTIWRTLAGQRRWRLVDLRAACRVLQLDLLEVIAAPEIETDLEGNLLR